MNKTNTNTANESFFAAANGYTGFRSLFGDVFNSEDHLRVFVLKGGPGTGKSTLMRAILEHGNGCGYHTKAIYCSSDPRSLDGVILKSSRGSVAILDGTAPHERDAIIPGAIDEIVNLGSAFNTTALSEAKKDILNLVNTKKENYAVAYKCLSICGHINSIIRSILLKYADYSYAEMVLGEYLSQSNATKSLACERYYISSFSKDGYQRIAYSTNKRLSKTVVGGDPDLSLMLLKFLHDKLTGQGLVRLSCPTPLTDNDIESFETSDRIFTVTIDGEYDIDARRLLNGHPLPSDVIKLREFEDKFLTMAAEKFAQASWAHFELEKIYTACVDFTIHEKLLEQIKERITNLLG